jgi:hypothetical protein
MKKPSGKARPLKGKPVEFPPYNSQPGKELRRKLEQAKRSASELIDSAEREENATRLLRRD